MPRSVDVPSTETPATDARNALRLGLVINRASGSAVAQTVETAIADAAAAQGDRLVVVEDAENRVTDAIEAAVAAGIDRLIVYGGDGTIAAAAQILLDTGIELAILPGGTMNILARDLSVPLDLDVALKTAVTGQSRTIDVGIVNGRVFLISAFLGFPTRLQRQREAGRGVKWKPVLWARMAFAALVALNRYPSLSLSVDLGGGPRPIRTRALSVTNNELVDSVAGGPSRGRLDQGELALYIARPLTPWRLIRLAMDFARGRIAGHPDLIALKGDRFVVRARRRRLHVMNDGERLLLPIPLVFTIRRQALRVVTPTDA